MTDKTLGIIGFGVIGQATALLIRDDVKIRVKDPAAGHKGDISKCKRVMICTPCLDGELDVLDEVRDGDFEQVIIRSTLRPDKLIEADDAINSMVVYWPEFLTEATAAEDVLKPDKTVLGIREYDSRFVDSFMEYFKVSGVQARSGLVPMEVAALTKLAINTFYAMKVVFFNTLFDACSTDSDLYLQVINQMAKDKRIAMSHENPLHGGYRGFGGKCLVKDSAFYADYLNMIKSDSEALFDELFNYNENLKTWKRKKND